MAVGDPSGLGRKVVSSAGRRRVESADEVTEDVATPLIKEADPELEKLLAEEEEINRNIRSSSEPAHFRKNED
jgi:small subunit ribosomal protein S3